MNRHKLFIYLLLLKNTCKTFIYLAVLGLSCGTGSRSSLQHVGSSSLPSMEPGPPALGCGVFTIGPPGSPEVCYLDRLFPLLGGIEVVSDTMPL